MIHEKTRILVVEDDMIVAANISLQLTALGYEVTGIESRGEEAVMHAGLNTPDIIIMDILLKGTINGIEAAKKIQQTQEIAIVYLTANTGEATFLKAKSTHPYAFIPKPFNCLHLERTIALVAEQIKDHMGYKLHKLENLKVLKDRIFVRHNGKMIKLLLDEILYIEADRNYSNIVTQTGKYLISTTLKTVESELMASGFIRVHRSYIVNMSKLDVVADHHLEIKRKVIPISKGLKDHVLKHIHTI